MSTLEYKINSCVCCYVPPPLIKVLKLSMHASFMGVSEEGGQQASCLEAVEFPQVLAHRHRKQGAGGATRPPSFKFGGHHPPPPNFTHSLHNEVL